MVSCDLFSEMMRWCDRSDWNFTQEGEKWGGIPIIPVRHLEGTNATSFEFLMPYESRTRYWSVGAEPSLNPVAKSVALNGH